MIPVMVSPIGMGWIARPLNDDGSVDRRYLGDGPDITAAILSLASDMKVDVNELEVHPVV